MAAKVLTPGYYALKGSNGMYLTLKMQGTTPYLTFSAQAKSRLAVHHLLYNSQDNTFVFRAANGRFWRRDSESVIVADMEQYPGSADLNARFKATDLNSGKLGFQFARDNLFLNRYYQSYKALTANPDIHTEVEVSDAQDYALFLPNYLSFLGENDQLMKLVNEKNHFWQKFNGGSSPY